MLYEVITLGLRSLALGELRRAGDELLRYGEVAAGTDGLHVVEENGLAERRCLGEADVSRDRLPKELGAEKLRITSYNVCYTKLLRLGLHRLGEAASREHEGQRDCQATDHLPFPP